MVIEGEFLKKYATVDIGLSEHTITFVLKIQITHQFFL